MLLVKTPATAIKLERIAYTGRVSGGTAYSAIKKNNRYTDEMKAVVQRVSKAGVIINGQVHASIKNGLMVLLGIEAADTDEDITWLSQKIIQLRIFNDEKDVMNLSLKDIDGALLLVSQFTLHASTKKGNRPSYIKAAKPDIAVPLYEKMIAQLQKDLGKAIKTGVFGADMKVELVNDGPVTIIMDTKNKE